MLFLLKVEVVLYECVIVNCPLYGCLSYCFGVFDNVSKRGYMDRVNTGHVFVASTGSPILLMLDSGVNSNVSR